VLGRGLLDPLHLGSGRPEPLHEIHRRRGVLDRQVERAQLKRGEPLLLVQALCDARDAVQRRLQPDKQPCFLPGHALP